MNDTDLPAILSMHNIHASYGARRALRGVDFILRAGEIHALVGEHGAGKSTLVNLLCGTVRKETGEVWFRGERLDSLTSKEAAARGIAIIPQTLSVIANFNAAENIFAGRTRRNALGIVRKAEMLREVQSLADRLGLPLSVTTPLARLSRAEQQSVELMRIVSIDPQVAIFDEVSSRFTPEEMEAIYRILFEFKAAGKGIIYISHDMDEIFRFADRVTILRGGVRTATEQIKDLDQGKLIQLANSFVLSRQELERDNLQLFYLKKYNDSIIQSMPVGIVILDPDGRVYLINAVALEILGVEAEGIQRAAIASIIAHGSPSTAAELEEAMVGREKRSWDELAYGAGKFLRVSLFPFRDDNREFIGTIILIQDVTKDRSFKEYWLRTERIASTAQLAAGVAHEINNPLGIVANYVELLKARGLDEYASEKLAKMEREIKRIKGIVGSLLSFSQVRARASQRIDVVKIADEVLELLNHQLSRQGIAVRRSYRASEQLVLGDENWIKQLLFNLLINGMEAIDGEGTIEIEIWNDAEGGIGYLCVRDDGCGIPQDIIGRIFDPFFTTKLTTKNAGLGLTVCHDIVENHGGVITCESVRGWTSFTIRLPLCAPDPVSP